MTFAASTFATCLSQSQSGICRAVGVRYAGYHHPEWFCDERSLGSVRTVAVGRSEVRERMYRAAIPRECEHWHALWLLARGWSAAQVADALERDSHTIGDWLEGFRQAGPAGLVFE